MRVCIIEHDRMMITPETDFEEEYLYKYSSHLSEVKASIKHGVTTESVAGMVIERVPAAQGGSR